MVALHNPEISLDLQSQVNELGLASWAEVPESNTGNFFTSDEYEPLLGEDCAGNSWQEKVVNTGYIDSYEEFKKSSETDWWHLLMWCKGDKIWKFWTWEILLSVAWWLPGREVIQGVIYPLFILKILMFVCSLVLSILCTGTVLGGMFFA